MLGDANLPMLESLPLRLLRPAIPLFPRPGSRNLNGLILISFLAHARRAPGTEKSYKHFFGLEQICPAWVELSLSSTGLTRG